MAIFQKYHQHSFNTLMLQINTPCFKLSFVLQRNINPSVEDSIKPPQLPLKWEILPSPSKYCLENNPNFLMPENGYNLTTEL